MDALTARVAALEAHMKDSVDGTFTIVNGHISKVDAHIAIAAPHIDGVSNEMADMKRILGDHIQDIVKLQTLHDAALREDVPALIQSSEQTARSMIEAIDGNTQ